MGSQLATANLEETLSKMREASSVCYYGMSSSCLIETSFGSDYSYPIPGHRESDENSIPSILVAI